MGNTKQMKGFYEALLTSLFFERYYDPNFDNVSKFYNYLCYNSNLAMYTKMFIGSPSKLFEIIQKENKAKNN
jgi:hypothetical protein